MQTYIFEQDTCIQDLDFLYREYGRCHVVHDSKVTSDFQEKEKPLAATRGISSPNL